ncbi:2273_t:CDS:10 [Acaulospora morrowiae]|uniref:2273_t:CDS:1 n=1 Tax=Acaulospora morrowiae TaxID=94023 RepID=A0A9N9FQQ5_9GLOM|nr:2273_t:CDS:10 [Acaulospora morrowiae]
MTELVEEVIIALKGNDLDKKVDSLAKLEEELLEETPLEPQEIIQLIPSLRDALRGSQIAVSYAALECLNPFVSLIAATHPGQLKNVITAFSPAVIDKLGDAKDKVRDAALQILLTMYSSASTMNNGASITAILGKTIKETAFGHKQWRVREQILQWIIVCTQQNTDITLRQWVPYIVKLLEDPYEQVRETAKDMIVLLFRDAPAHAKSDLKRELKDQSIRPGIVDYILSKVAGNQSPNDIQYDRHFENHHTNGGAELTEDDYSNGETENEEVSKPSEFISRQTNSADSDIGSLQVDSAKELEREFQNLLTPFQGKESEQNWSVRERGINRMRSLVRGDAFTDYPEAFINGLKISIDGILKSLLSLRTTLSLASAGLIRDLATHLGPAIDPFADNILADLIRMVSSTKKLVSQAAANTANDLLQRASYHHRLITQLWHAMEDKNIQVRSYAIGFVKTVIISHGDRRDVMERSGGAETLEKCVKKGLTDASPKVRETCREVFWAFYEIFPDRGERIMKNLEPAVKKQVERDRPKNLVISTPTTNVSPTKRPTTPSPKRPTTPSPKRPTTPSPKRPTTPSPKRPTTPSPKRPTTPGPKRSTTPGPKRPVTPASPSEERNKYSSMGNSKRRSSYAATSSDSGASDNYSTQSEKITRKVTREQPKLATKPSLRSKSPAPPSMARSKSENPSPEAALRPKSPFSPQGKRISQIPPVPRKLTVIEQLQHVEWSTRVEGILNTAQLIVKRSLDSPYGKQGTVDHGKLTLPPDDVLSSALINMLYDPDSKVIESFFNENVFKELSKVIQLEQMIPKVLLIARDEENPDRAAMINHYLPSIKSAISTDKILAVLNKCLVSIGNFGTNIKKPSGFTTPQKRKILNGILTWFNEVASTKIKEAEEGHIKGYLGEEDKYKLTVEHVISFVPSIKETSENYEPLSDFLITLHKLNADIFESVLFTFDSKVLDIVGNIIGWEEELMEAEEEFLAEEQERLLEEKRRQDEEQQEAEKRAHEEMIQGHQKHEVEMQQKRELEKREQEFQAQMREYELELQQQREQREQRERILQQQREQREQWEREREQQKQREQELIQKQELELIKFEEESQLQRKHEAQLKRDQELQLKREREIQQEHESKREFEFHHRRELEFDEQYEHEMTEKEIQNWEYERGIDKQNMLLPRKSNLQRMASQPSLRQNQYRNSIKNSNVNDLVENQRVSQLSPNGTPQGSKDDGALWDNEKYEKVITQNKNLPRDLEFEDRINRLRQRDTIENFNERGDRSLSRNSRDSEWSQRYSPRTPWENDFDERNERSRYRSPRDYEESERDSSRDSGYKNMKSLNKDEQINQDTPKFRDNNLTEKSDKEHLNENHYNDVISEKDINQVKQMESKVKQTHEVPLNNVVSLPTIPREYKLSDFDERDPELKNLKELVEKLDAEENDLDKENVPENFVDATLHKPMSIVISEDTWKYLGSTLNGNINPFFVNPEDRYKNGGVVDSTLTPIKEVEMPEVFQISEKPNLQTNTLSNESYNKISSKFEEISVNQNDHADITLPSPLVSEISNGASNIFPPETTNGIMGTHNRAIMSSERMQTGLPLLKYIQEKRLLLVTNLARLNNHDVDDLVFRNLTRLSKETPLTNKELADDIWEHGERFGELITALIGFLSDPFQKNVGFKDSALILLGQLLINQFDYASDRRLERDILHVLLECRAEKSNGTYIHAEEILENYIRVVDSNGGLYALIDIMESNLFGATSQSSAQSGMKQGAFSALSWLVKRFDQKSLERQIGIIVPLTLKGINDPKAEIRKSVVDSLVAIYSVIGDDNTLFQYLAGLNPSQLNLLNYYFDRSRNQQRESIAARGVPA